jgi:hypothetical protein
MGSRKAAVFPLPVWAHADQIASLEAAANRLRLNVGRAHKSQILDAAKKTGVQLQSREWQNEQVLN